eukprot:4068390-Lingulodinium_polyedra.AAC.1
MKWRARSMRACVPQCCGSNQRLSSTQAMPTQRPSSTEAPPKQHPSSAQATSKQHQSTYARWCQ